MPWMNNQTCSACVRHTCLEQVRLNDDAAVTYLGGVAVATVAGRTGVTGCASGVRCISAMGRGISAMGRGGRHCLGCRVERSLENGAHGGHALSRGSRRVALSRWCLEGHDEWRCCGGRSPVVRGGGRCLECRVEWMALSREEALARGLAHTGDTRCLEGWTISRESRGRAR